METDLGVVWPKFLLEISLYCQMMNLMLDFIENGRWDHTLYCPNLHLQSTSIPINTSFPSVTESYVPPPGCCQYFPFVLSHVPPHML